MSSGDLGAVIRSAVTLESSAASLANNTMSAAMASAYDVVANGGGAPDADFVLSCQFATAPAAGTTIDLYAQDLDIDGTGDARPPTTSYRERFVGSFVIDNTTAAQYLRLSAYDVPPKAAYYLHNNGTGQTMSAGAKLVAVPRTINVEP